MEKNINAVALGKLGGSKKTPAKIEASKRNGALGGRPKNNDKKDLTNPSG